MVIAVKGSALTADEIKIYTDFIESKYPDAEITEILIEPNETDVVIHYHVTGSAQGQSEQVKIKRIPGYTKSGDKNG